ncbi:MAG: glycosyltransferase family 2 protein [Eubacteriales bacterium]
MDLLNTWMHIINLVFVGLFLVAYANQFFYMVVAWVKKPRQYPPTDQTGRYAVLIAARNEERVLPFLLDSLHKQSYPADRLTVYVVADNCTDGTARMAAAGGAVVFERHNTEQVGKGYALQYLLGEIDRTVGMRAYRGYFVFDADNVLNQDYIAEMDKAVCAGGTILTSYRNSKNYGDNWISAGYALWFLREAKYLNNPRSLLGIGCAVSGTGFYVDSGIIADNGGWTHYLLTEDIEFSAACAIKGHRIGYCHDAVLYDEQPVTFSQSWTQRKRWSKGFLQMFRKYGGGLFKGAVTGRFTCFDLMMTVMPAFVISIAFLVANTAGILISLVAFGTVGAPIWLQLLRMFLLMYGILFFIGATTALTEWRRIWCKWWRLLLSLFTFPFFMMTYIPISIAAIFMKVRWEPIHHRVTVDESGIMEEVKK